MRERERERERACVCVCLGFRDECGKLRKKVWIEGNLKWMDVVEEKYTLLPNCCRRRKIKE